MVNTQFYLPFFQRLLLRTEIIDIRIRCIICLSKECFIIAIDDCLRQLIQLFVIVADQSSVQNMIIVPTTVKADKSASHKLLNLRRARIDHSNYWATFALDLPVHEKQVWKDLNIVKDNLRILVLDIGRRIIRLEVHLIYKFKTIVRLMSAACSKGIYRVLQVRNIIIEPASICVVENFVNEIHTRFGSWVNLLMKIFFYQSSKPFFILHSFEVYHFIFSFQWQPRANCCNR